MATWAIGDIHGQASLLDRLLDVLPRRPGDTAVFLGDYIDRGPDSARVVARVLAELDSGAIALWGNHEDMAAAAYGRESPGKLDPELARELWLFPPNGGPDTLRSFDAACPGSCPSTLEALLGRLQLHWTDPETGIEFVHANAPSRRSLLAVASETPQLNDPLQGPALLLWETPRAQAEADLEREVLVGHTSLTGATPERRGHHLLIDTNAARGGPLTALELDGATRTAWQVFPGGALRCLREHPNGTWEAYLPRSL